MNNVFQTKDSVAVDQLVQQLFMNCRVSSLIVNSSWPNVEVSLEQATELQVAIVCMPLLCKLFWIEVSTKWLNVNVKKKKTQVTLFPFWSPGALEAASSAHYSLLFFNSAEFFGVLSPTLFCHPDPPYYSLETSPHCLVCKCQSCLCLREYAEIKWSLLSVVNHRRGRMSPEVSPEHTVCQYEEACWSLTDRGLKDNICAFFRWYWLSHWQIKWTLVLLWFPHAILVSVKGWNSLNCWCGIQDLELPCLISFAVMLSQLGNNIWKLS